MNTDDKIRTILREQAETVDPSPAGWDAITSGVAARRRRVWWLRGGAFAGAALATVTAVAYVASDDSQRAIEQVPATSSPSLSPSPAPSATVTDTEIWAVWPLTRTSEVRAWQDDHSRDPALETAQGAAAEFAKTYLGIADSSVVATGRLRFDVTRPIGNNAHVVTTLVLGEFGDGGGAPYVVVSATSPALTIEDPRATTYVTSPLATQGTYVTVDPSFTVRLRAGLDDVATARATTSPPAVWEATLTFPTTGGTGSILVTNGSLADSGIDAAVAIPVTFGIGEPGTPASFYGIRDGRVVVVSAATGEVVDYLTDAQPGGGASGAFVERGTVLYAQGAGTCAQGIWAVPGGGQPPTNVVPAENGYVFSSPSRYDDLLAYVRTQCDAADSTEVIIVRPGAAPGVVPVGRGVVSGPVAAFEHVAFVTGEGVLTVLDVTGSKPVGDVPAPTGCRWTAVTWHDRKVVAAAGCGGTTRLYSMSEKGTDRTLVGSLGSLDVATLDYNTDLDHLVIGAGGKAYTFEGGVVHPVPGGIESPTW